MSLFMIFLSLMLAATPQEEPVQPVTLSVEQAVEIAFQKNPTIQVLVQEIESAKAQTLINSSLPDAEAGLEVEALGFTGTARNSESEFSFGLIQPFPFPGKLKLRARIGESYESEARLRLEKEKILLASEVKKAYYRCLLNQKTEETLGKNLELLEEIQKNAISRYALGAVPYTDLLRVRIEIARTRNALFEARKELAMSFSQLNQLLGLEKDTPLELTSTLQYQPLSQQPDQLIEKAKASSPTLKISSLQKSRSELLVKLAEKNRLPDFSFGFYTPSHRLGAAGFSFGLSYPLFSWKRLTGEKQLAAAEVQKAVFAALATEKFYESRKKQALSEIRQAEQQVKAFEESLLMETEAELEKALNDYRLGRLDSLNLLDLYRNASLVRLEYYRALYFYHCSLAEFERAGEDYE
ncbi:MAG: TolC family protein [Candidatus Aminicenantes bacterium]|nr:TolC family protein [Candidatus Aminicenantes bacterium]